MNQCVFGDDYKINLGLVSMYVFGGDYKTIQGLIDIFLQNQCMCLEMIIR